MAEAWFDLTPEDQREVLDLATARTGRPFHVLEKDIWVVWSLSVIYNANFAHLLTFKGGTSLSKVYGVIDRFSEDVDLTYDIRSLVPDLLGEGEQLPTSRNQAQRIANAVHERLQTWIQGDLGPLIKAAADQARAGISLEIPNGIEKLIINYSPLEAGTGYTAPRIQLELGARATGEPKAQYTVTCDAATAIPDIVFPTATPLVMRLERTFWEKATAAHVYCLRGRFRGGDRFSRHWYDLAAIAKSQHFESAVSDKALANEVARHKGWFFRENDASSQEIDYELAVNGRIQLVPSNGAIEALRADYEAMIEDGLLENTPPTFAEIVDACLEIQNRING